VYCGAADNDNGKSTGLGALCIVVLLIMIMINSGNVRYCDCRITELGYGRNCQINVFQQFGWLQLSVRKREAIGSAGLEFVI
jgi:hypothetical protein